MPHYTKAEALRWLAQLVACNGLDASTKLPRKGQSLIIASAYSFQGSWRVTAVAGGFTIISL